LIDFFFVLMDQLSLSLNFFLINKLFWFQFFQLNFCHFNFSFDISNFDGIILLESLNTVIITFILLSNLRKLNVYFQTWLCADFYEFIPLQSALQIARKKDEFEVIGSFDVAIWIIICSWFTLDAFTHTHIVWGHTYKFGLYNKYKFSTKRIF